MSTRKLRKVETLDDLQAVTTYEVVVDGKVMGTVTKYIARAYTQQKNGRLRHRDETSWAWHRGHRSDGLGYGRQSEAIDWLMNAVRKERGPASSLEALRKKLVAAVLYDSCGDFRSEEEQLAEAQERVRRFEEAVRADRSP